MALNASQHLKVVGFLVIGLSGLLLFLAAVGLAVDQKKIIDALLVCMALWGLATGIGLLRLRPLARLSSLVFYSFLCISGALSVAYIVVRVSTSPSGSISTESVVDMGLTACFALPSALIGIQGLRFFKRNDIRTLFGGAR
jgi:hypothetical protein